MYVKERHASFLHRFGYSSKEFFPSSLGFLHETHELAIKKSFDFIAGVQGLKGTY